jgi:hypothetical protein
MNNESISQSLTNLFLEHINKITLQPLPSKLSTPITIRYECQHDVSPEEALDDFTLAMCEAIDGVEIDEGKVIVEGAEKLVGCVKA